jgi:hypothetical protein
MLCAKSYKHILFSNQIFAFDELKNDHKNPIEQCNSLNLLILPEYWELNFLRINGKMSLCFVVYSVAESDCDSTISLESRMLI